MMNDYHDQKAVIYARYSSHNQTEQSIEGQLHDAYAFLHAFSSCPVTVQLLLK